MADPPLRLEPGPLRPHVLRHHHPSRSLRRRRRLIRLGGVSFLIAAGLLIRLADASNDPCLDSATPEPWREVAPVRTDVVVANRCVRVHCTPSLHRPRPSKDTQHARPRVQHTVFSGSPRRHTFSKCVTKFQTLVLPVAEFEGMRCDSAFANLAYATIGFAYH